MHAETRLDVKTPSTTSASVAAVTATINLTSLGRFETGVPAIIEP